jgi:hypothetical protein
MNDLKASMDRLFQAFGIPEHPFVGKRVCSKEGKRWGTLLRVLEVPAEYTSRGTEIVWEVLLDGDLNPTMGMAEAWILGKDKIS